VPDTRASGALLSVRDLGIRHDGADAEAPAGASFVVNRGEVVLLLGPSGAGKSTLALALNGLVPHAVPATVRGRVEVDGLDTAETPVSVLSTRVGMVFQDPDAQLVTGTLLDEVAFGPENLRLPVADVLERAEEALRRVGLWDRRHENPDRLSGGGRQRLAIACALAMGSPLLVLDEPTANLDPQGVEEVYATLGALVAAGDRAIVLVEHNLDAVVGIVDRVVVLDRTGRTVADGTVDEVLRARAAELHEMGVWLPVSTLAALRLRAAGWTLDPLPLDPTELRTALDAADAPAGSPAASVPSAADVAPVASAEPLIRVRGLRTLRGRREILHGIDLECGGGRVRRDRRRERRRKDDAAAVDRRGRPGGAGAGSSGRDRCRAQRPARAVAADRLRLPESGAPVHRTHGVRRTGARPAAAAARRERGARAGLRCASPVRPRRQSRRAPLPALRRAEAALSVGTALVAGAPVLALDEPTFGQDRARADELMDLLEGLSADGTTILVVTHDMQLVTEHAHRTIIIGDGRVVADAATAAVFADDALVRAAGLRQPPLRRASRG
jgi:energy-coupling factor transport system ATP-binding protein